MKNKVLNIVFDCLTALPFIMLLSGVFVLDKEFTNGTGIGKAVAFYSTMVLIPIGAIISFCMYRRNIKYCFTDLLICLFVVAGIITTYIRHTTINSKMYTLVLMLCLYFCLRIYLVQRNENRNILVLFFILTGLVEAVWGLMQLYSLAESQHVIFKVTGSFFNPGPFGGYLAMIFPMALYYSIYYSRKIYSIEWQKKFYVLLFKLTAISTLISFILILPVTMSRASWIACITGGLTVLILYTSRHKKYQIKRFWKTVFLNSFRYKFLILLCTGLTSVSIFYAYSFKKDSADGRMLIWKLSLNNINENVFGTGIGYFSGYYGEKQSDYFAEQKGTEKEKFIAGEPEYAFNEFIQIAVEFGILCLVVFLIAIICGLRLSFLSKYIPETGSMISLLTFSCMSYPFSLIPFLIGFTFLLAMCVTRQPTFSFANDLKNSFILDFRIRSLWNRISMVLVLVCCFFSVIYIVTKQYPTFKAHQYWGKVRPFYHNNNYGNVVDMYAPLFPYLNDQVYYLFEYGQSLSKLERHEESIMVLSKASLMSCDPMIYIMLGKNYLAKKDYKNAEKFFLKASNLVPYKLYPYYLLAQLYDEIGLSNESLAMAKFVVHATEKISSPATEQMKEEMRKFIDRANLEQESIERN